ncbi:MAG TPA: hypothetical protein PLS12_07510, partial [Bacteroidales bacterium]|nr:hypothetical protein [Bacteroidales bacterium]
MKSICKFCLFLIFLISYSAYSQSEYISFFELPQSSQLKSLQTNTKKTLVELPFFDDFAKNSYVLSSDYWADSYGLVNNSFGKNTITIGVLSLDGLDNKGKLYSNLSSIPSVADIVTSQPINLKSYKKYYKSDKLYIKNNGFQLLTNDYYVYQSCNNTFESVSKGFLFAAGDTIYHKVVNDYIPVIDSIFDENFQYILGTYTFEQQWYNYTIQDSIALSFYYQSGGNADKPESTDSLVLEFYTPFQREGIFINEITTNWIEIYNATDTVISLYNWFIVTDTITKCINQNVLEKCKIKNTKFIAPYSHAIIFAKDVGITKFTHSLCMLYNPDTVMVDSIELNEKITDDFSYARIPDGNIQWSYSVEQTPEYPNSAWNRIWATSNDTKDFFSSVFIPIVSSNYLQKGFRFRFKNYVSLSNDVSHARNEDIWNIDMVWLDVQRKKDIINTPDVAFVQQIAPLYNQFSAIPISHFSVVQPTNFRLTIDAKFNNFDSLYRKVKFGFALKKHHVSDELLFQTYETDIPPYTLAEERDVLSDWNVDFIDFMKQDIGVFDETKYEFQYYFTDNNNIAYKQHRWNDTSRVNLVMANYYAYDDGIPEAGYGLREAPMGRVAYKYSVLVPDTLKAIDIYFNPNLVTAPPIFNLCIWSMNSNGLPGSLLYKMPGEKVQIHEGIYKFVTYTIKPEGILTNDRNGIFIQNGYFIGWEQPYDVLLNVGLDLTSNLKNKIYYNVGFEWVSSTQNGALL